MPLGCVGEAMPPSVELVEVLTQDEVDNIWGSF